MTRILLGAAVAAALAPAFAPPASASTTAVRCDFGPQIGTICLRDPMDHLCPILEGQTLFGIKCAD